MKLTNEEILKLGQEFRRSVDRMPWYIQTIRWAFCLIIMRSWIWLIHWMTGWSWLACSILGVPTTGFVIGIPVICLNLYAFLIAKPPNS